MIIDGQKIANKINEETKQQLDYLNLKPSLAVVLVGNDPPSKIYVEKKKKACEKLGIHSEIHLFSSEISQKELENVILNLKTNGILVQLPLPINLNKYKLLNCVPPEKDVDCFNAINIGKIAQGTGTFKPCTPFGIMEILRYYDISLKGKRIVIINNSQVIGIPLFLMLSHEFATVTMCHEHTSDLFLHTLEADIIVTAVGKYPNFELPAKAIKKGAIVIDVAMNRINNKLFGDVVDFDTVKEKTSLISPVPGCVGLTTVACLMRNTILAAKEQQ